MSEEPQEYDDTGATVRVYVFVYGPNVWKLKARFADSDDAIVWAKHASRGGGMLRVKKTSGFACLVSDWERGHRMPDNEADRRAELARAAKASKVRA